MPEHHGLVAGLCFLEFLLSLLLLGLHSSDPLDCIRGIVSLELFGVFSILLEVLLCCSPLKGPAEIDAASQTSNSLLHVSTAWFAKRAPNHVPASVHHL